MDHFMPLQTRKADICRVDSPLGNPPQLRQAVIGGLLARIRPTGYGLALPKNNQATMIQEVLVPGGTLLERSRAIPVPEWGRLRGGAEQFKLLEAILDTNFGSGVPLR